MIPSIKFSEEERGFIKRNRRTLRAIFKKELDYVFEYMILEAKDDETRKVCIQWARYFKDWVNQLIVLEEVKVKKEEEPEARVHI